MKRLAVAVTILNLCFCLAGNQAIGGDFFVVAGGGPSGKVLKTQVFTSGITDNNVALNSWAKLSSPQWTYAKVSPTSYLVITYQDTINLWPGPTPCFSAYQLRVNDQASSAGDAKICYGFDSEYYRGVNSPSFSFSATGVWTGLPQGDAILSIWHYSPYCAYCTRNVGFLNTPTTVTVMEIENK